MTHVAPDAPPLPPALARERDHLEALYRKWHRARFIAPDPLEFVRDWPDLLDREMVAFVASSLAYGNVTAMRAAIASVLAALGARPARESTSRRVARCCSGFRYRFTSGAQMRALIRAVAALQGEHGTIGTFFRAAHAAATPSDDVVDATSALVDELRAAADAPLVHLVPHPGDGSACKRLNLMLRWLVRRDAVDPGGWTGVPRHALIMPLDTHVHRTALERGWTTRRGGGLTTALDVTAFLRRLAPEDPLRYDFAITRPGIRKHSTAPAAPRPAPD